MNNTLTLDKIVSFEKTYSFSRAIEGEGEYRHIHYGDIHTKLPSVIEDSRILPKITEANDFQVVEKGDILVADASEDYKDLGKAVCYMGNDDKVIAGLHTHLLRCTKDIVNPEYLINLFQTNRYKKYVWRMGTGVSVLGLSKNNLGKYEVSLPAMEEQNKKAKFFNVLNNKIQLQQQKIDLLQEQKKGFLQKMFPKAGEKQPQVRFDGFTDDWEQCKLRDLLIERNEQVPENSEYKLMSFVQGKGVVPKGERYDRSFLVKNDSKKYKKTELGDFIYSSNNLETGSIGFNRTGKAVISPVYSIFSSKGKRESEFIGIISQRKDFISKMTKYRQGVVYGQWRIHEKDFLNISITIPNEKEQESISNFFKQLDDTIALHKQKLDLYKEQKKGFMQQMFI